MKLHLLEFIQNNPDWEKLLSEKPYSLSIKRDGEYILFMYSQIDSDFSNPIVQECRGITFHEETWKCVSMRFKKFFNVQEVNASQIDWSTASVQEKLDGSLVSLWYHNGWHISTNGTIDARKASLQMPVTVNDYHKPLENYYDLFIYATKKINDAEWIYNLNENHCYMFELVSPYNKIVVPYQETEIYHIGTRDMTTLWEEHVNIGVKKPKIYSLKTLNECLEAAEKLPFSKEGWVVVDSYFNRVKIKGSQYVIYHYLKGNGVVTKSKILNLIRTNGQDDFKSVFPEYKETIERIEKSLDTFIFHIMTDYRKVNELKFKSRKEMAEIVNKTRCPSAIFSLYDKKKKSLTEWLWSQTDEKILKLIGEI